MFNQFQKPSAKDFIYIKSAAAVQEARMWLLGLRDNSGWGGSEEGGDLDGDNLLGTVPTLLCNCSLNIPGCTCVYLQIFPLRIFKSWREEVIVDLSLYVPLHWV